jgi:hypothetical protein
MKTITKAEVDNSVAELQDYFIDIVTDDLGDKPERLGKLFGDYSECLKAAVQPPNSPTDEPKAPLEDKLQSMVDAMIVAAPTLDRQTAHHFLLHTAQGRRLAEHLNSISKTERNVPMQVDIAKLHNIDSVIEVAKNVIDDKVTMTEAQFNEILTGHAKLNKRQGESTATAFSRIFSDPENIELRKAHQVTKGF